MNQFENLREVIQYFQELLGDAGRSTQDCQWDYSDFCRYFSSDELEYYQFEVPDSYHGITGIVGWGWDVGVVRQDLYISALCLGGAHPVWRFSVDLEHQTLLLMMPGVKTWHQVRRGGCQCGVPVAESVSK